jgi:hypothetical protein
MNKNECRITRHSMRHKDIKYNIRVKQGGKKNDTDENLKDVINNSPDAHGLGFDGCPPLGTR